MKNYILGLLSVFFIGNHAVMAQDCSKSFFALKENTRFSMGHFDAKGKLTSTSESTIKSVTKTDAGFTADVTATMKNDKGKSLVDGKSYTVTCDNGTIKMDIGSMFTGDMANQMKNMEMTITGDGIDIPATLTEGMSLKGGASTIKMGSNGMNFMTMTFDITNRKVEKKETITVKSGTYEAYKVSYDLNMKVMIKKSMHVVQWLVPSVGMVKSENYNSKNELESYMEMLTFEQ